MFDEANVIDRYTRSQAIADGVLIEAPAADARQAGFVWPVALTTAAWADCVAWSDEDDDRKGTLQDQAGRLWDVLYMASRAVRQALRTSRPGNPSSRLTYSLVRIPREGRDLKARRVELELVFGPGDNAEPVITIGLPGED